MTNELSIILKRISIIPKDKLRPSQKVSFWKNVEDESHKENGKLFYSGKRFPKSAQEIVEEVK